MDDWRQKQNDILAQCIHLDTTGEVSHGEERIKQTEGEERCLRRAMWLMALITMLSIAALGYSVILLHEVAPYYTRIINHILVVVALASSISLATFAVLWIERRNQIAARREESRQLIIKLLAERSRSPAGYYADIRVASPGSKATRCIFNEEDFSNAPSRVQPLTRNGS